MFKKFLSLFMWWKQSDRGDTPTPKPQGFNHNQRPAAAPWPNPAGTNRRIQPEPMEPFKTGTPHDRMHDLIVAGKPDALIAIELGVDIAAVRNYRHIISAPARAAARKAALLDSMSPMFAAGSSDDTIAAVVQQPLQVVQQRRAAWRSALRNQAAHERVPAALLRRRQVFEDLVRQNETFGKFGSASSLYDPDLSPSVTAEGCARVMATLDELARIESQCPAPSNNIESGQGGDFGGAGATGSWDGDRQ